MGNGTRTLDESVRLKGGESGESGAGSNSLNDQGESQVRCGISGMLSLRWQDFLSCYDQASISRRTGSIPRYSTRRRTHQRPLSTAHEPLSRCSCGRGYSARIGPFVGSTCFPHSVICKGESRGLLGHPEPGLTRPTHVLHVLQADGKDDERSYKPEPVPGGFPIAARDAHLIRRATLLPGPREGIRPVHRDLKLRAESP
jgi:hypothetical protein